MMWSFAWKNLVTRPTRTALAVIGLTIPVLAFLGLFSLSGGIRHLMGGTLASMDNLMVLSANTVAPVFRDLPPETGDALRKVPGVRGVAAEAWKVAPPIDGQGGGRLGGAAFGMLTRPKGQAFQGLYMNADEGQNIRAHAPLKCASIGHSILPASQGGGEMLNGSDAGKPHVVIGTEIAHDDYPNSDGSPRRVGQTVRIGRQDFTIVGLYHTGSLLVDATIVMDIGMARKLLGLGHDAVSTYNIEQANSSETDTLAERFERAVLEVRVQRISRFNLTAVAIIGRLDLFLLLAVALAVLVGAVGIANTMPMSTSERYVEFGVMRTNGWTRRNVLTLVTAGARSWTCSRGCSARGWQRPGCSPSTVSSRGSRSN